MLTTRSSNICTGKYLLHIKIITDSVSPLNVMIINALTTESRLIVYIKAATEAYRKEIMNDIIQIRRKFNFTDSVTKTQINVELVNSMNINQLNYDIENSIIKNKKELQKEKENYKCEIRYK